MSSGCVDLVVCGAPLARYASKLVAELEIDGWAVSVVPSESALPWLDFTPAPGRTAAGGTRRPRADAVIAAPATFNTLNKLRAGISDTQAVGALNDAIGERTPVLAVPMVSERLVGHPAWAKTLSWLAMLGVVIMDPIDGSTDHLAPIVSGMGDQIAAEFDAGWLRSWLTSAC